MSEFGYFLSVSSASALLPTSNLRRLRFEQFRIQRELPCIGVDV